MKIFFNKKHTVVLATVFAIFLCGFASVTLSDIEMAIIKEDYLKAQNLSQSFIDAKPQKKDLDLALYFLGLSQLRLKKFDKARDTFNLLISGFPAQDISEKAHIGFIDALFLGEDYVGAIRIANKLLSENPNSQFLGLIYLKLASANLKLARWPGAELYLNKIIKEFPGSFEAHRAKQLFEEKNYFTVQVGAFLDRKRAENLTEQLKAQDEYAYIVETVDYKGRNFYRVRVGQMATADKAKQLMSKLSHLGYPAIIYP